MEFGGETIHGLSGAARPRCCHLQDRTAPDWTRQTSVTWWVCSARLFLSTDEMLQVISKGHQFELSRGWDKISVEVCDALRLPTPQRTTVQRHPTHVAPTLTIQPKGMHKTKSTTAVYRLCTYLCTNWAKCLQGGRLKGNGVPCVRGSGGAGAKPNASSGHAAPCTCSFACDVCNRPN